jgi:hypothetical protein
MTLTVFLLDYKRFPNILHKILPSLLSDSFVSQIVICHGSYDYDDFHHEKFPRLQENEVQIVEWEGKQVLRIQDPLNSQYEIFVDELISYYLNWRRNQYIQNIIE